MAAGLADSINHAAMRVLVAVSIVSESLSSSAAKTSVCSASRAVWAVETCWVPMSIPAIASMLVAVFRDVVHTA